MKQIIKKLAIVLSVALVCSPMGAMAANKLIVKDATGVIDKMVVTDGGAIGSGTNAPDAGLHVKASTYPANTVKIEGSGGGGLIVYTDSALPTISSPRLGYVYFGSRDSSVTPAVSRHATGFYAGAGANWTSTSTPSFFAFETTAVGSTTRTERMRIDAAGNVGIGTTAPSHKLEIVNGGIRLNNNAVQPVCDNTTAATMRGTIWFVKGTTGVADTIQVCARGAVNYAWKTVTMQ